MANVESPANRLRVDPRRAPIDALRALALARDAIGQFIEVRPGSMSAWRLETYGGHQAPEAIDYPHAVDFGAAAGLGLLLCHQPAPGHMARSHRDAAFFRFDLDGWSQDFDVLCDLLGMVTERDFQEAAELPDAVPVALVAQMRDTSLVGHNSRLKSLVGETPCHLAHGYMVGETKNLLLLRGMTMADGSPATPESLRREDLLFDSVHAYGLTTVKHWARLSVGMSREAFLRVAEVERRQAAAFVETHAAYEKATDAAMDRLLEGMRKGKDDLSAGVGDVLRTEGLAHADEPGGDAKALRLAVRLINSLHRPAADVVRDAAELESGGAPKRAIIILLNEAGLPCTYGDYKSKLSALRKALDLASPGRDAEAPLAPTP